MCEFPLLLKFLHFQFQVLILAFSISFDFRIFHIIVLFDIFAFSIPFSLSRISIILWFWWLSFSSSVPCMSAFQCKTPVIAKVVMTVYVLVSSLYDWIPPMSPTFPRLSCDCIRRRWLPNQHWSPRFLCSFSYIHIFSHYITNLFPCLVLSLAHNWHILIFNF